MKPVKPLKPKNNYSFKKKRSQYGALFNESHAEGLETKECSG